MYTLSAPKSSPESSGGVDDLDSLCDKFDYFIWNGWHDAIEAHPAKNPR